MMSERIIYPILIVFAFVLPSCSKKSAQTSLVTKLDSSIRRVNWDSLFAHDPIDFKLDSSATADYSERFKKNVFTYIIRNSLETTDSSSVDGFWDSSYYPVHYVDLNHDGREDAVLTFAWPGSGIWGAAVIFLQTSNGPKYVGCMGGAHFRDTLYGDTLDVVTGHWLHDESECCPEAEDHQRIIAENDSLHFLPVSVDTLKK